MIPWTPDVRVKFYKIALPALAFLLGYAIYKPGLTAPFYFDDNYVIVDNPIIKNLNNLPWLWFHDPSRFLTHLSFALNYFFHALEVSGYHQVNLCIHFLNALFLYALLKLLFIDLKKFDRLPREHVYTILIFSVFIFLCHPLQTQAVTYVAQRSTLLASAAYLATLLFYLRYRITGKILFYFFAIFINLFGLFTKPIIITLPVAIVLCEIHFLDFSFRKPGKLILRLLPFLLLAAAVPFLLILWRYKQLSFERLMDISQETLKISRGEYVLTQFSVFLTYLRLLILPINQNLDYDYPIVRTLFNPSAIFGLGVILAIVFAAVKLFARQRVLSFAIFWFLLTLSLESSFFPIADVINEHRLYLPIVGFAIFLAVGLSKIVVKPKAYVMTMAGIVVIFSLLTFNRNQLWNSPQMFLGDMARHSPNKSRVHNNFGQYYFSIGELLSADQEFKKAIAVDPQYPYPYNNLGTVLMAEGQLVPAQEAFEKAVALKPNYAEGYYNLGNIFWFQGRPEEARELYEKAAQMKPFLSKPLIGLGNYYAAKEDNHLAKVFYLKAIYLNPSPLAFYSLGNIYLKESKFMAAVEQYWKAIDLHPGFVDAYNNIGNIYAFHDLNDQAMLQYWKTVQINPRYGNGYYNLGNMFNKKGKPTEAKRMLAYALKLYTDQNNTAMTEQTRKKLATIAIDPNQSKKSFRK